jgi:hypothetical protein
MPLRPSQLWEFSEAPLFCLFLKEALAQFLAGDSEVRGDLVQDAGKGTVPIIEYIAPGFEDQDSWI